MRERQPSVFEFPCRFPVKVFGRRDSALEDTVFELVRAHVPELERADLSRRSSSRGRYLAVTAHIVARSQAQLDAIYTDLSASADVLMSL